VTQEDPLKIPEHVTHQVVGSEAVALDLASGTYFTLNRVATRIWQLAAAGESRSSVLASIVSEFDVTELRAAADLDVAWQQLLIHGLVEESA